MGLSHTEIEQLADRLDLAKDEAGTLAPLQVAHPDLSLDDAYAVQRAWTARQAARGMRKCGYKLGLTTPVVQQALGIDRPIHGPLFETTRVASGARFDTGKLVAPRIEPELAFFMKSGLSGQISTQQARAAIGEVAPALEIIDNRIAALDPASGARRNALDIIADGGGGCAFVLGDARCDPGTADLRAIEVVFTVGETRQSGSFASVFGDPVNALVELSRELAQRGEKISAGDIVLTGAPMGPVALAPGQGVTADYGPLGTITLEIT